MPYVFAQFLNSDATTMGEALATYHKCFDATKRKPPRAMLALSVLRRIPTRKPVQCVRHQDDAHSAGKRQDIQRWLADGR